MGTTLCCFYEIIACVYGRNDGRISVIINVYDDIVIVFDVSTDFIALRTAKFEAVLDNESVAAAGNEGLHPLFLGKNKLKRICFAETSPKIN